MVLTEKDRQVATRRAAFACGFADICRCYICVAVACSECLAFKDSDCLCCEECGNLHCTCPVKVEVEYADPVLSGDDGDARYDAWKDSQVEEW